jgi:glutamate-5-semialdehyde dehydrogenase
MNKNTLEKNIDTMTMQARKASRILAEASPKAVNRAILKMAALIDDNRRLIEKHNMLDVAAARQKGIPEAMIDRLTLSEKAVNSMIRGLNEVSIISTPVGTVFDERTRPNGLKIHKVKTPIGVIAIIYESRPNVTVDAAAICLKSHNAVILRGGSEAFNSNAVLVKLLRSALKSSGLPGNSVQFVSTTDRTAVSLLLKKSEDIDLVIPRGGEGLIRTVVEQSHIPVIKHYKGVCHVFISRNADMKKAIEIAVNAKIQRPATCNAMETMLLDSGLSASKRKLILKTLIENNVTIYGDTPARALIPSIRKASKKDWLAEYLDLRLAVRTVNDIEEAVEHINTFGSHHTDAIVSESVRETERFTAAVDSSSVMVNASTRFSDGGEYGMGCEIGISTDKLHSRGPMGVEDLTTYKWVVLGNGQIRK